MKKVLCIPLWCLDHKARRSLGMEYSLITQEGHLRTDFISLENVQRYCSSLNEQGVKLHAIVFASGTHLAGGFMDDAWDFESTHPRLLRSKLVFDEEEFLNVVQGLLPCIEHNGHIITISTAATTPSTLGHKWPAPPEVTSLAFNRYMVMEAGKNTLIGWLRRSLPIAQKGIKIHRIVHAGLGGTVSADEIADATARSLHMDHWYFDTGFLLPFSR